MRSLSILLFAALCAGEAVAADLAVQVRDTGGAPVTDAVVSFTPAAGVRGPIRFDWPYQIAQRDLQFEPHILIVPVGAEVRFPNLDRVRHHVYSFAPGNRFELELYGRDESRAHRFERAGVAAIGCNIHDQMQAYIVVVDTPHVARTNAAGVALVSGVSGAGEVRVWHPLLRAPGGFARRTVALPASGRIEEQFSVQLRVGGHAH